MVVTLRREFQLTNRALTRAVRPDSSLQRTLEKAMSRHRWTDDTVSMLKRAIDRWYDVGEAEEVDDDLLDSVQDAIAEWENIRDAVPLLPIAVHAEPAKPAPQRPLKWTKTPEGIVNGNLLIEPSGRWTKEYSILHLPSRLGVKLLVGKQREAKRLATELRKEFGSLTSFDKMATDEPMSRDEKIQFEQARQFIRDWKTA